MGRKFWVSISIRERPKHCLVFCGVRMDSELISQPSLGILHVREKGIRLGSHFILCRPLLPPFDSVSLHISLLEQNRPQASFEGSKVGVKKDGLTSAQK